MPFTHVLHSLSWLPQTLETIHMAFHSLLVGAFVVLALRLIGFGKRIPIGTLARYLLPACWIAFGFLLVTGTLMFIMTADKYVQSQFFLSKLGVVLEGIVIMAVVQYAVDRNARRWDEAGVVPAGVQVVAAASIPIWFAALTFGRLIYTTL